MNLVELEENLDHLIKRGFGVALAVSDSDHLGETDGSLGVTGHDGP